MLTARAHPDHDELVLEQVDRPRPGPGDVLVRVATAGIAPGAFHLVRMGRVPLLPVTLGHEIAGEIAELGGDAGAGIGGGLAVGQRVRVHPNLTCRACEYCLTDREQMCASCSMIGHAVFGPSALPLYEQYHNGGLAEFVKVPRWAVDPLPDNVGYDVGAKVHDLANALRALKLAALRPGATVILTAATGAMGVSVIRLAPLFGVTRIVAVGRSAERLDAVRKLAPNLVEPLAIDGLDPSWAERGGLTAALRVILPTGADAVVDFFPEGPGTGQALAALRTGGTMVHMGANTTPLGLPAIALSVGCWRLVGTRNCTRNDAREVLGLLESGAIAADDLITHSYPLTEVNTAVATMLGRTEPMWMTVIHP